MKTSSGTGTDMARCAAFALVIILAGAVTAASAVEEYYLYTPARVETPRIPDNPADGVLARTVTVQRGDTLRKLSRKFSGRSAFFPQILLFNRIKNPDLIYVGDRLRIPVTRPTTLAAPPGEKRGKAKGKPVSQRGEAPQEKPPTAAAATGDAAGQRLFARGVTDFKAGRYRPALDSFEEFLKTYPDSPQAADAALYRADCYMKLAAPQE